MDAIVGTRGNVELQRDLMRAFAGVFDIQVELDVEAGLDLPGINLRRTRIFDREVLHILRENRDLRLAVVVCAVAARAGVLIRHELLSLQNVCAVAGAAGMEPRYRNARLAVGFLRRNAALARQAVLEYLR